MISINFIDTEILTEEMLGVKEWIRDFVKSYDKEVGELYYSFCSDEYLYKMNVDLLGHDFYTDIITFPLNECETILSAEFHISIDRIKENAATFERSFRDELHRVMAHGVLRPRRFAFSGDAMFRALSMAAGRSSAILLVPTTK